MSLLHEVSQSSYKDAINKMAKKIDELEWSSGQNNLSFGTFTFVNNISAYIDPFVYMTCMYSKIDLPDNFVPIDGYLLSDGEIVEQLYITSITSLPTLSITLYNSSANSFNINVDYTVVLVGIVIND